MFNDSPCSDYDPADPKPERSPLNPEAELPPVWTVAAAVVAFVVAFGIGALTK